MSSKLAIHRSRGMALIAVLWIVSLLAILAAGIGLSGRTHAELAFNSVEKLKARASADAGVHQAIFGLIAGDADRSWPKGGVIGYRLDWDGARVDVEIHDEDGKIDLNVASEPLLRYLFEAAGVSEETAARLARGVVEIRGGGDRSDDRNAAVGMPLRGIERLNDVSGMTPALFHRIRPHVTIHSGAEGADPSRASNAVLRALARLSAEGDVHATSRLAADDIGPAADQSDRDAAWLGDTALPSRQLMFAIRTSAESEGGARFVREAIVALDGGRHGFPAAIQVWQQGR